MKIMKLHKNRVNMQLSISVEDGETSCPDKTEVTKAYTLMYYKDRPSQHKLKKHNRLSEKAIISSLQQRKEGINFLKEIIHVDSRLYG